MISPSCRKVLGIIDAEGLIVYLANLRVSRNRRRRWTRIVMALTVTFTVCDAQQIGLSSSYGYLSLKNVIAFQTKRPEQKAPLALNPLRLGNEALALKLPLSASTRLSDDLKAFQYALPLADGCAADFCLRLNSCESPRAPPLMDPPTLC